jgi:hypothetical protein
MSVVLCSAMTNTNPPDSPRSVRGQFQPLRLLTCLALVATYPLLALSLMLPAGLAFGSAFVVEFVIHNSADRPVEVTPVGTAGQQGKRRALPVMIWRFPAFPATQRGGFRLAPGESVSILYDWDDINFSEIVVRDADGVFRQLVVNPNPTTNQYHPPDQRRFVIDDAAALGPVTGSVLAASNTARRPTRLPWIILGLMFLPWPMYIGLRHLRRAVATGVPVKR